VLLFGILLQIATGVLLLLHYAPDTEDAFDSVRRIMWDVPFGWLFRLAHVHGANLLIVIALVHLAVVAVRGGYKAPRELVWITGCLLLVLLLAAGVTGYALPWSQLSYWAVTIVTSALESVPLLGDPLLRLVRGGEVVGAPTLRRAFAAHVVLVPATMVALVALHVFLIGRSRLAGVPERARRERESRSSALAPGLEYALWVVLFLLLLSVLVFLAPGLGMPSAAFAPADPLHTPLDLRSEWFMLWAYHLFRVVPSWLAFTLQLLLLLALLALPFVDRSPHAHPMDRPWILASMVAIALGVVVLSVLGATT
jgi:quinol-cytochrome oxidoreductase complex cytochrome b subunit